MSDSMPNPAQQNEARALLSLLKINLESKDLDQQQLEESLTKLKVLGRDVDNVATLYDEAGVKLLGSYAFGENSPSIRQEALRCIANALLLLPQTRQFSLNLDLDTKATDALQSANEDEEFLLARILFLLTYVPGIDLKTLILDHDLAGAIIRHLSRHASHPKKSTVTTPINQSAMALQETLKLLFNVTSAETGETAKFNPAVDQLFQILSHADMPSPPLQPPISLLINALANLDVGGKSVETEKETQSAAENLMTILEASVQRHSSAELDTIAIPLLTVLRHVNESASPELRDMMKARLLPDDHERDQPLGKSSSLASRLLQLTTSSGLLNLSEAISALMFELSDKDANQYVKNVGYGYAAGYLMSHKIPVPASARKSQDAGGSSNEIPINPITGQRLDKEAVDNLPQMTDEEKEREAERLFVLFERLKATGVVDVKNPVEQARDEGRFEELSDSDPDG